MRLMLTRRIAVGLEFLTLITRSDDWQNWHLLPLFASQESTPTFRINPCGTIILEVAPRLIPFRCRNIKIQSVSYVSPLKIVFTEV